MSLSTLIFIKNAGRFPVDGNAISIGMANLLGCNYLTVRPVRIAAFE
jgi:hypothetical protein